MHRRLAAWGYYLSRSLMGNMSTIQLSHSFAVKLRTYQELMYGVGMVYPFTH